MTFLSKFNPFRFPSEDEQLEQEYARLLAEDELTAYQQRQLAFKRHMAKAAMAAMDEWRATR